MVDLGSRLMTHSRLATGLYGVTQSVHGHIQKALRPPLFREVCLPRSRLSNALSMMAQEAKYSPDHPMDLQAIPKNQLFVVSLSEVINQPLPVS
jgi:hypothetical protein